LGHFRILRSIGEGEFGKVKLGVDARTGQEVAVKLVRKEGLLGAKREKLMREIALLKTAHHPHIVKLFDIIETERHVGLVMEYAAGGELFEHILQRKMLKESEAKALFRELCGGVSYLHAHGIVHRDLKLENLLLTHDRHLLITDFGFATTVRRSSPTEEAPPTPSPGYERRLLHTSCGSPCYAAPELVLGEGGYDGEKADAWSCGVILFAMCCGYLPFDDDPTSPSSLDISRLYRHIVTSTISFPDHVTAGAREVIRGLLDTEPEDRWSVAKAAQHWWVRGEKPKRDRIGAASSTDGPERGGLVAGMINRLEVGYLQPFHPSQSLVLKHKIYSTEKMTEHRLHLEIKRQRLLVQLIFRFIHRNLLQSPSMIQ
ncbi:Pkinase-domain-containing protein, partial [Gonapodya prolifera JEL478]